MATRAELEKLVSGDKVLNNGIEMTFLHLKDATFQHNYPVVLMSSAGHVATVQVDCVTVIKPKQKLYAYEDTLDGELRLYVEETGKDNHKRRPEWDREL